MSTAEQKYARTLPGITPLTKPFWDAAKQHTLVLQRCRNCQEYQWYPKAWCSHCGSRSLEWTPVSGQGTVYSFTVIRQVIDNAPAFQADIPFVVALIELAEGPRMYSNVTGCKPEEVVIGMRVKVWFDDVTSDITLPKFSPA